ncbi:MAG: thermonuclease family protein [Elusimicrobia bacterium]|nr:thermonuclease family protein [Elusimicrobiota bacterium]
MKKIFCWLILVLTLAQFCAAGDFSGQVVSVSDGDTIEVLNRGKAERIRLYGIDCPEKSQAYGAKAKDFTSGLVSGKKVYVLAKDKDRYGRIVAEVRLVNGINLNRELVRNGYAWWYRQYAKERVFEKLENEARLAKRGLWKDENPTPPWEYRKEEKPKSAEKENILGKVSGFFKNLFKSNKQEGKK